MNLNTLNNFLNKNPKLLFKYVSVSMTVIGTVLKPINAVMKHALVVQGIDPATEPGERQRKALQKALDEDLNKLHSKDFDDDYDFSWARKTLGVTNAKLQDLHLTKEAYHKLTDISKFDDKPEENVAPLPFVPSADKKVIDMHELRVVATEQEKEVPADAPTRPMGYSEDTVEKFLMGLKKEGTINAASLKEALKTIQKFSAQVGEESMEDFTVPEDTGNDNPLTNFFEKQRTARKEAFRKEKIAAEEYNLARKLPKPIETYKKGGFQRVDKKKV